MFGIIYYYITFYFDKMLYKITVFFDIFSKKRKNYSPSGDRLKTDKIFSNHIRHISNT